jgi:hypothetical protein
LLADGGPQLGLGPLVAVGILVGAEGRCLLAQSVDALLQLARTAGQALDDAAQARLVVGLDALVDVGRGRGTARLERRQPPLVASALVHQGGDGVHRVLCRNGH